MKRVTTALFGAACALALTASSASAYIACNRAGDCWHVKERYSYRPNFGISIHPDNWRWRDRDHARYRWREHEGRGYWREGVWIGF